MEPKYNDEILKIMDEKPFDVMVPNTYNPHISEYAYETGNEPIFNEDVGFGKSKMPMNYIVDMYYREVDFRFCNPDDLTEMITILNSYMNYVTRFPVNRLNEKDNINSFTNRCLKALNKLKILKERYDKACGTEPKPVDILDWYGFTENFYSKRGN